MGADPQSFKNIMSYWASGISIITTSFEGEWYGFTASSFASVSIDPFLISMSMTKTLRTHEMITSSRVFAVNILTQNQTEWAEIFAGMVPEKDEKRFDGIPCTLDSNGCPLLPDTIGHLSCQIYQTIDVGASTLILGQVVDIHAAERLDPMVYFHRQWGYFTPTPKQK